MAICGTMYPQNDEVMSMKNCIIKVRVDDELKQSFEAIIESKGLTPSKVIRNFIEDYVKEEQQKIIRDEETIDAIEDVLIGNLVKGEAALDWLNTWGTTKEKSFSL